MNILWEHLERPEEIAALVEQDISRDEISVALDRLQNYVDLVINNPASVAKVFASRELDSACISLGTAAARNYKLTENRIKQDGTMFLLSRLVAAGGHIELLKDIIRLKLLPPPYTVLVSDCFQQPDDDAHEQFRQLTGVTVVKITGSTSLNRLEKTLDCLNEINSKVLVILTHNQDSAGLVAALAHDSEEKLYVHHGDHHLSLGVTLQEVSHIDICNHSFFQCRAMHQQPDNRYWPLTTADIGHVQRDAFFSDGAIVTAICGRPEKFSVGNYKHDYFELLPRILEAGRGQHIHIGNLAASDLERIYTGMDRRNIDPARFKHLPWVPSLARSLVENKVDLYLSSFPIGGGKSVIEAMSVGVPLLLHSNYHSRFSCGGDAGYPQSLIWQNENELLSAISNFTAEDALRHSHLARRHFERYHTEGALAAAMNATGPQDLDLVPPVCHYVPDPLEAFVDQQNRTSDELRKLQKILDTTKEHETHLHNEYIRVLNAYNDTVVALDKLTKEVHELRHAYDAAVDERQKLAEERNSIKATLDYVSRELAYIKRQGFVSRLFGKR